MQIALKRELHIPALCMLPGSGVPWWGQGLADTAGKEWWMHQERTGECSSLLWHRGFLMTHLRSRDPSTAGTACAGVSAAAPRNAGLQLKVKQGKEKTTWINCRLSFWRVRRCGVLKTEVLEGAKHGVSSLLPQQNRSSTSAQAWTHQRYHKGKGLWTFTAVTWLSSY